MGTSYNYRNRGLHSNEIPNIYRSSADYSCATDITIGNPYDSNGNIGVSTSDIYICGF